MAFGPTSKAQVSSAATSNSRFCVAPLATLRETLSLPGGTLSPGRYTFVMANDGQATHAIEITGPGVEDQKSGTAGPGGTSSVTVTLKAGNYTIFCPVGNHRAMGMQTSFTVG